MRAIKISATVRRDRTIVLQLPRETPEGLAEVIVLVPENAVESTDIDDLLKGAEEWRAHNPERRTKEAIDHALGEERGSWDNP